MFADAKSLFYNLTKSSSITEKLLMIDVQTVRNAYASHEISNLCF